MPRCIVCRTLHPERRRFCSPKCYLKYDPRPRRERKVPMREKSIDPNICSTKRMKTEAWYGLAR